MIADSILQATIKNYNLSTWCTMKNYYLQLPREEMKILLPFSTLYLLRQIFLISFNQNYYSKSFNEEADMVIKLYPIKSEFKDISKALKQCYSLLFVSLEACIFNSL